VTGLSLLLAVSALFVPALEVVPALEARDGASHFYLHARGRGLAAQAAQRLKERSRRSAGEGRGGGRELAIVVRPNARRGVRRGNVLTRKRQRDVDSKRRRLARAEAERDGVCLERAAEVHRTGTAIKAERDRRPRADVDDRTTRPPKDDGTA
jgi:hypothetical protein